MAGDTASISDMLHKWYEGRPVSPRASPDWLPWYADTLPPPTDADGEVAGPSDEES